MDLQKLKNSLTEKFGESEFPVHSFEAPARINIIGEHVDYLGGFVLPAAIDFYIYATIRKRGDNQICLFSRQYDKAVETTELSYNASDKWTNYIYGVVSELRKSGFIFGGFEMAIDGNIPQGAGVSSSAALEVVTGFAISSVFNLNISRERIALFGQAAENNFVGMRCGIMDQFIISVGRKDCCILLNTGTLEYSYQHFQLQDFEFYLVNSNVKHSLQDSAYNERRKQCESALKKIREYIPGLPDIYSLKERENISGFGLGEEEKKRVLHVLGEKRRTREIMEYLRTGNFLEAGKCLYETHLSLSSLFEVSCEETDFIVNLLKNMGVTGARMIGGGFGGCVLVLDKKGRSEEIRESLSPEYKKKFNLNLDFYKFSISDGVKEIFI